MSKSVVVVVAANVPPARLIYGLHDFWCVANENFQRRRNLQFISTDKPTNRPEPCGVYLLGLSHNIGKQKRARPQIIIFVLRLGSNHVSSFCAWNFDC